MKKISRSSLSINKIGIKNFLLVLFSFIFSLILVGISALRISQSQVKAQAGLEEPTAATAESAMELETVKTQEVDYYLPYPGILPDHPLYWLKMLRDRIMLKLASPSEKLARLLLYADKRIGAAEVLVEGGKIQLGVTTATKAEKYLEQAVSQWIKLGSQGKATPEMTEKLSKAFAKHKEILEQILVKVPDQTKAVIEEAVKKNMDNYQKLAK